jgi:predicted RNase H-like HicB family nuclease
MSKYVALIEKTGNGYSVHVLDLPGCIAAAQLTVKRSI